MDEWKDVEIIKFTLKWIFGETAPSELTRLK
jgi:hypothetical protein